MAGVITVEDSKGIATEFEIVEGIVEGAGGREAIEAMVLTTDAVVAEIPEKRSEPESTMPEM